MTNSTQEFWAFFDAEGARRRARSGSNGSARSKEHGDALPNSGGGSG